MSEQVRLVAQELAVNLLQIDPAYQRLVQASQVAWIVKNYEEVAFGRILVGRRADTSYWVVDGQQRLTAARKRGMTVVPCLVFDSTGRKHEAKVFKEINSSRKAVSSLDVFRASMEAGESETLAINACVEEAGFKVGRGGGTAPWNILSSPAALRDVFRTGGVNMLHQVLSIIRDAWEGDATASKAVIIAGLGAFCLQADGQYSRSHLVKRLREQPPTAILRFITDHRKIIGGGSSSGSTKKVFVEAIVGLYNKKLRTNRIVLEQQEVEEEVV
jgi:hypothetical protein